jgi:hypothetical protein
MGLGKIYIVGPRIKENKKFDSKKWINIEDIINTTIQNNNSITNYIEHTAYNNSISSVRLNSPKSLVLSKSIMQSIAPKIRKNNGVFNTILTTYVDIDFKQDGRVIRSIQNIGLFDHNSYNDKIKAVEKKYKNMWETLYNSYRMLKYINIDFANPNNKLENVLATEISDYINMVDSI